MQRPSRTVAVRLSLWTLLFASLAMSLVQPVQAGSADAPEIQDPASDRVLLGVVPVGALDAVTAISSSTDLTGAWIDNETADSITLNIDVQNAAPTGNGGGTGPALLDTFRHSYTFHLTVAGTEYLATGSLTFSEGNSFGGVATGLVITADGIIQLTVPKANIANPAAGATATALSVNSQSFILIDASPLTVTDRAPNAGAGLDYTFTGGGGGTNGTAGDLDGDGLNDTCETQYFGSLTAQNATGDPDGDGLTNGQECALGTDPTKADTDGDGCNDKVDSAPTDATKGCASSSSSSSSHSGSSSSHSSSSSSQSSSSTSRSSSSSPDTPLEKLKAETGYLGLSAGGFLTVVILCIIGLAVRWSL